MVATILGLAKDDFQTLMLGIAALGYLASVFFKSRDERKRGTMGTAESEINILKDSNERLSTDLNAAKQRIEEQEVHIKRLTNELEQLRALIRLDTVPAAFTALINNVAEQSTGKLLEPIQHLQKSMDRIASVLDPRPGDQQ